MLIQLKITIWWVGDAENRSEARSAAWWLLHSFQVSRLMFMAASPFTMRKAFDMRCSNPLTFKSIFQYWQLSELLSCTTRQGRYNALRLPYSSHWCQGAHRCKFLRMSKVCWKQRALVPFYVHKIPNVYGTWSCDALLAFFYFQLGFPELKYQLEPIDLLRINHRGAG